MTDWFIRKVVLTLKTVWMGLGIYSKKACVGSVGFLNMAGSSTPVSDAAKVAFGSCLSEVAVCLSLIVLRKKQPGLERPFKMWGDPVTPILAAVITFILVCCVSPKQIPSGSLLMLASVPAYLVFRRMAAENKTAAG